MIRRREVLITLSLWPIIIWQHFVTLAVTLSSSSQEQLVIDDDTITKLSEIFDLPNLKRPQSSHSYWSSLDNNDDNNASQPLELPVSYLNAPKTAGSKSLPQPPPYMINLFNTIADHNGVMRIPNPYHANLIKSFPNKDFVQEEGLHFDVSSVHYRETILQAELHLNLRAIFIGPTDVSNWSSFPVHPVVDQAKANNWMTKKNQSSAINELTINISAGLNTPHTHSQTPWSASASSSTDSASPQQHLFIHVYLIESLFPLRKRLIGKKSLTLDDGHDGFPGGAAAVEWHLSEVITVRPAVVDWINRPNHNYGLHVSIISTVKDTEQRTINFKMNKADSRQPVLILFMDDGRPERNPKYRIKSSAKQNEYVKNRLSRLGQAELYQSFTAAERAQSPLPIQPSSRTGQDLDSRDIFHILPLSSTTTTQRRNRRSLIEPKGQRFAKKKSVGKKYRRKESSGKGVRGSCRRHQLYVSFEEIGWSSWIISPKGFQAFHCRGDCNFPIGQESKPSNHATVMSIISHLKLHKNVAPPCCVPEKLYSISLLYFDNQQNVILKQYDDMVAQSCACR